jgi:PAS domain S-box-containing protein
MPQSKLHLSPEHRKALRIALVYFVVSAIWILVSDELVARVFRTLSDWQLMSQAKGITFVVVTGLILYVTVLRSLRSVRKSQAALEESERLFASFMENLPVAAFLKTMEGRLLYVNDYWRDHFYSNDNWREISPKDFLEQYAVEVFRADDRTVVETGQPVERTIHLTTLGREADWLIKRFLVLSSEGGERLVGGFAVDITDRIRLEEQLRQAAKMEAVGLLAGGVAHDFNNLLTVINGYAEILARRTREESLLHPVKEIKKAGERAAALTQQLLAFSRRQILTPEEVDLNAVVDGVHSILLRLIGERIRLEVSREPGLFPVEADRVQLEQVLMNFAVNARDAMPDGGTLSISTKSVKMRDDAQEGGTDLPPGDYVQVTVADTGCGMDEKTMARVFEPFFTTKERGRGTGLGLSTVYGIVKQSGGAVSVSSTPGKGSMFSVYLPRAQGGAPKRLVADEVRQEGTESILLVEDERSVRDLLSEVLERLGYKVLSAESGEAAIALMQEDNRTVDLLVTDVVMPGMSGPEMVRVLRKMKPSLRVIYITGYSEEAMAGEWRLEQGDKLIQKPFSSTELAREIRAILAAK